MQYLTVEEARGQRGVRLVLTTGTPAPWGEAVKAMLHVKNIGFLPVGQVAGESNDALVAWTGLRNAPILVLDDEPPRDRWLDQLARIELLAPTPALLPAEPEARALVVGLCNELAGEEGLGWSRRVSILAGLRDQPTIEPTMARILDSYRVTKAAAETAPARSAAIVAAFAARLHRQAAAGSAYLVGDGLTAADLYLACFSAFVGPLPHAVNPMPEWVRQVYDDVGPQVAAVLDPVIFAHRAMMYERHLALPLDF